MTFNTKRVMIGQVPVGKGAPLALIAGPCVIENRELVFETAKTLKRICSRLGLGLIFKSSFDKANRSSIKSFRGPGFEAGLNTLAELKNALDIPVISDIHETWQVKPASKILDALQIPAFLARQTDLLVAAADSGLPVNVKKGQFMAPDDMLHVVSKVESQEAFSGLVLCERGSTFGYHNLVVDMRSLIIMRSFGWPVAFDATHSVQLPSAGEGQSIGQRRYIPALARAAVAVGLDALFMETHPKPEEALCDGFNQWPLDLMEPLLKNLLAIHNEVWSSPS